MYKNAGKQTNIFFFVVILESIDLWNALKKKTLCFLLILLFQYFMLFDSFVFFVFYVKSNGNSPVKIEGFHELRKSNIFQTSNINR